MCIRDSTMEYGFTDKIKNERYAEYNVFYDEKMRILRVENIRDFDLARTFECGQCFRWNLQEDGSYVGTAGGRAAALRMNGGELMIENCERDDFEEFWFDYLDLGRDYAAVKQALSENDAVMAKAAEFGGGIRLLQQDPWETVISFIISQNSNIPRIKKCIDALCTNFGDSIGIFRGEERFSFPKPERLARLSLSDLSVCRLGYRDKYVLAAAQTVARDGETMLAVYKRQLFYEF